MDIVLGKKENEETLLRGKVLPTTLPFKRKTQTHSIDT